MAQSTVNWEDEENNRIVQLSVEYRFDAGQVEVENVTPEAIVFVDATSRQPIRRLQVWTETGRRVLRRAQEQRFGSSSLQQQLESQLLATAR